MNKDARLAWYTKEFNTIREHIKYSESLTHYDFLRIRNYKLQNLSPEQEETIKEITHAAFMDAEKGLVREAITKLTSLEGCEFRLLPQSLR
jgi:hypothetical protein